MNNKQNRYPVAPSIVYIPATDEQFLDMLGNPWTMAEHPQGMNLGQIIIQTLRKMHVDTGEDAERSYDIIQAILSHDDGFIILQKDAYDWLMARMKKEAHLYWLAPEAIHLIRHIKEVASAKTPDPTPKALIDTIDYQASGA